MANINVNYTVLDILKKYNNNELTNYSIVKYIDDYGTDRFFVDLWKEINVFMFAAYDLVKISYAELSFSYHNAKKYFEEH